jgi:hypothetical protein
MERRDMSIDRHVYLGPYVACRKQKDAGEQQQETTDTHEVARRIKERLMCPYQEFRQGCDYWLSNQITHERNYHMDPDTSAGAFVDEMWGSPVIQLELADFRRRFAAEIGVLREAYGAENMSVDWGFFLWAS